MNKADLRTPHLERQIRLWTHTLLDYEVLVDDARAVRERADENEREAVRRRDSAALHLSRLIVWADEPIGPMPEQEDADSCTRG